MNDFNLFIPIGKIDEAQRTIYGVLSAEEPDKSGEIMDYASGKPEFMAWSDDAQKRSGGKSKGNVRAMHGDVAAGKMIDLHFDDANKIVSGAAKIVDDAEWQKVLEGVYTGFSIGGSYKNRWRDPSNPDFYRFTPQISEVSIVDNPCVPTATFELVRADGSKEIRKFKTQEIKLMTAADEKGIVQGFLRVDDATFHIKKADAGENSKQGFQVQLDKSFHLKKEAALQREQDLIAKSAGDPALEALAALEKSIKKAEDEEDYEKRDFTDKEREEAAKAGEAMPDGSFPIKTAKDLENAVHAYGRAKDKDAAKAHIIARAKAIGATEKLPDDWKESEKAMKPDLKKLPAAIVKAKAKKSLHSAARIACIIEDLNWLEQELEIEAVIEGDESEAHEHLEGIVHDLCDFLESLVEEECSEIIGDKEEDVHEPVLMMAAGLSPEHAGAIGKYITNRIMKRALRDNIAKAGARHSKSDEAKMHKMSESLMESSRHMHKMTEHLAAAHEAHGEMHECMKGLGVEHDDHHEAQEEHEAALKPSTGADHSMHAEKMVKMATQNTALNEKIAELTKAITDKIPQMQEEINKLSGQPAPGKGALFAVEKGHEAKGSNDRPVEISGNITQGMSPAELKSLFR